MSSEYKSQAIVERAEIAVLNKCHQECKSYGKRLSKGAREACDMCFDTQVSEAILRVTQ